MPTFPQWEATVLDHCYDTVDFISLHNYFKNPTNDLPTFLAESVEMELFITTIIGTADFIKAKKRSKKTLNLSFDEWNVWFHSEQADERNEPWAVGPHLLEDVYTMEDALVVGCCLITLLRHADRVRIACLAQLVNTIAPIMTVNGGPAWRQTIFYPFLHASLFGRGEVLQELVHSPTYENRAHGIIPWVETIATCNREAGTLTIFAVSRHQTESLDLEGRLAGFDGYALVEHIVLANPDPKASNTRENPLTVIPSTITTTKIDNESLHAILPPLSWNVIRLKARGRP
jgi:alpha-N-arabinofuranosidase